MLGDFGDDLQLSAQSMPGGGGYVPSFLSFLTPSAPAPSGGVVQVSTPNTVNVGYGPPPPPPLPPNVACANSGGMWSRPSPLSPFSCLPRITLPPKTPVVRLPVINLRSGSLTSSRQVMPLVVPPAVRAVAVTKILTFAKLGGGGVTADTLPPLGQPLQVAFEQRDGLWIVSAAAQPVLQGVLGAMVFSASDPSGNSGQASFSLPSSPDLVIPSANTGAAVVINGKIANGYAALLDKSSTSTGVLKFVFTNDPSVVATLAGTVGSHALITDKPDAVVAPALAQINGGVVPSSSVAMPKWVVPVVVGVGVLAVGAIAMVMMSKKKAVANRRRRHRR